MKLTFVPILLSAVAYVNAVRKNIPRRRHLDAHSSKSYSNSTSMSKSLRSAKGSSNSTSVSKSSKGSGKGKGSLIDLSQYSQTVFQVIDGNPSDFVTLRYLVRCAGLVEALSDPDGTYTLFAPDNGAFSGIDLPVLCQDVDTLVEILLYHLVDEVIPSPSIKEGLTVVPSLQGQSLDIVSCNSITVNDANVTTPDVFASNGVIHTVDSILLPPDAAVGKGGKGKSGGKGRSICDN